MNWFILSAIQFVFGFLGTLYLYFIFNHVSVSEAMAVSFFSGLFISNSLYCGIVGVSILQEGNGEQKD